MFRSLSSLLAAAVLLVPLVAEARGGGRMRGPHLERMANELQLDPQTKQQIRSVFQNSRAEAKAIRGQLKQARRSMRVLMRQEPVREALVMAKADEMHQLKGKLKKIRLKTKLQVRQLLTPEQRQKMRQLRKKHRGAFKAACQSDLQSLCPDGNGRRQKRRCLMGNFDKLSQGCRGAIVNKMKGPRR